MDDERTEEGNVKPNSRFEGREKVMTNGDSCSASWRSFSEDEGAGAAGGFVGSSVFLTQHAGVAHDCISQPEQQQEELGFLNGSMGLPA
jgi:hypothetical protein